MRNVLLRVLGMSVLVKSIFYIAIGGKDVLDNMNGKQVCFPRDLFCLFQRRMLCPWSSWCLESTWEQQEQQ